MTRIVLFPAILLFVSSLSTGQQPAKNSEVALTGLHGRVRTVLTETFDNLGNPQNSTLAIYDPDGYLQEEYRYDPDGSVHSHIRQLCVAKQIANDVCAKRPTFGVIAGQEFHRAEPVIFVLPVWFNVMLSVHTFRFVESAFSNIS